VKKTAALLLSGLVLVAMVSYAEEVAPPAAAPPAEQPDISKFRPGQDYITLNFSNIDIAALVKVMSELTRKNFILDERVTGKVTLMTPTKISPDEAYQVFLSALEIKGFTAVEDGRVIRIIPTASARQSGLKVVPDGDLRGQGYVTKLIRMTFVNPQDIVRTLTPLMSKDGNLIAYSATNSLIVTDSVHNIKKIESLLRALDVAAPEGKGKINVYYLKYANAEDTAKVMSALLARVPAALGGAQQPGGPSAILEGTVTIAADKATNSLIIVGSPIDYETIKDVIQKLDIRRRQVYVEAAIIEMSLTKMRDLGFEFLTVPQQIQSGPGAPITPIGGTNFGNIGNVVANGPAALANMSGLAVGVIKGTFTYNNQTFLNVGALLHALQTDGDVNVLSTPNILTMDNQKAEIMVGQNVPFITGQTQNATTGTGAQFNTIERKDVGIKLALTPQITSDDNVRLDINQEISDVIASTSANAAGPTTSKRSASTTVVVKDRQTMVIGGLIRDNVTSSESKVPFLGDIPILGWFFKSKTTSIEKTNLMIFITPYIINNEQDAADITRKKGDAIEEFRKEHRIEKKDMGGLIESSKPALTSQPTEKPRSVEKKDTSSVTPTSPPIQPSEESNSDMNVLPPSPAGKTNVPAEGAR
jgi:general secretion pathway protein D